MKKIIITIILLLTFVISKSQELPIYSDMKVYGNLTITKDIFFQWTNQLDTMGMVIGKDGKAVMIPLIVTKAGDSWDAEHLPFYKFYKEAKNLKALPLPSPDGTENRQMVPFNYYQIEYELERPWIYLKRIKDQELVKNFLIVLLIIGFIYQQRKIIKLKKGKNKEK